MHGLAVWFGLVNPTGHAYMFWSAFGSDLGEVTIVGGLAALYRKHTCEVHRCWRLQRHATAAGHNVCRRHHPDGTLSAQDVVEAHRRAV
jgi:hypothetical protein